MNALIEKIKLYKNGDNNAIIDDLISDIEEESISSVDELENLESNCSYERTIAAYIKDIDGFIGEYDTCTYDEIQLLKKERSLIGDGSSPESIKHLIIYCSMTNRINPFPYITYKMIINGDL